MDSGPVGNDLSGSLLLRPYSQFTSGSSLSLISRYRSESKVPKREAHIASAKRTAPVGKYALLVAQQANKRGRDIWLIHGNVQCLEGVLA